MRIVFAGQVPKDPAHPGAIEDAFALDAEAGLAAISDGASESFDSRRWAGLLVEEYVGNPVLNWTWLDRAIGDYAAQFSHDKLSWAQEASFERGSFATLLGLRHFSRQECLEVFCVGDSIAVILDGEGRRSELAHPDYDCSEAFRRRPVLFSTKPEMNRPIKEPGFFEGNRFSWPLAGPGPWSVLCMTDAFAAWALGREEQDRPVWQRLSAVRDQSDLETLVSHTRRSREMRIDDVTFVHLSFGGT